MHAVLHLAVGHQCQVAVIGWILLIVHGAVRVVDANVDVDAPGLFLLVFERDLPAGEAVIL